MPIFEEICLACQCRFEALVMAPYRQEDVDCPRCHSKKVEQQYSTFSSKFSQKQSYRGDRSNPYENLTLQHVRDERNKPIQVNSLKELRAAEKKYGFVHAFSAQNDSNLCDAPQHEAWAGDVRHDYEWKWTPPDQRDDTRGVDVGVAAKPADTLAYHPNA